MEREDEDRSRSPRMRSPEVSDKELLSSTTALAVGMTTMVAALKGATTKMEAVLEQSKSVQQDLCKSLEVVSTAITGNYGSWDREPEWRSILQRRACRSFGT